ncbi:DUF927 domain-containing protein [Levilactobacillus brevis]|uniref:DUF927 domain-containing protein n=1 Tax=Levilactobacillus brevis TaxID=1580 RepID=A0AA41ERZ2_LEVBR|nr:DUF927 domain-containing protein [Levilactobacillus brevis]MBS0948597.1 DUF927 domain-containing protein [Levilactobacillus brevis]MBS1011791.1 DUF927 domain-containing protein [Levilactobacillus brevis]
MIKWSELRVPNNFKLTEKGVYFIDKNKHHRFLLPPIALVSGTSSREDGTESYKLQYISSGSQLKERVVPASSLTSREIESWAAFGVNVTPMNKNFLLQYLMEQRRLIPIITVYSNVGWLDDNCFGTNEIISLDGRENSKLNNSAFDLLPRGSRKAWFEMWSQLSDSIPLQLALTIGLTAPLLKPLSKDYPDLETLIFSIVGNSSTGKSSMLSLLLSTSGAVQPMQEGSLFQSWSSTSTALSLRLNGNHGIVQGLDELSRFKGRNITDTLYNLSSGTEKARATKSVNIREAASWQTTIVSTGEHGFLDGFAAENQGLKMRIVEYNASQPWTRSSEEAELIKRVCASNYGWLLPEYIRFLLSSLTQVRVEFPKCVQSVKQMMPKSPYRDRISVKLAVVKLAAELANATWSEIDIDVEAVMTLLVNNTTSTWSTDLGDRMYGKLLDYLKAHQASLMLEDAPGYLQSRMIGTVTMETEPTKMFVNLYPEEYKRIVTDELGAQSDRVVSSALKEKGYLKTDTDRNTLRRTCNGKRTTVVSVVIPTSEEKSFVLRKSWDKDGIRKQY